MRIVKLLLVLFLFFAGVSQAREIKFVHITDMGINPENASGVLKTIKEINEYPDIDFVLFGGNNISKSNIDNLNVFLYLLKKVHKRKIVLLGSSDVLSSNGIDKKYYLKRVNKSGGFRLLNRGTKTNYTFSLKGYRFIVMDGSKQYFQSSNGYYNSKELIWLDKQLKKYQKKDVIILQHFPILKANSGWLETFKTEDYYEVLNKYKNVKMIISGHYGNNIETEKDGIYHIITESYSKKGAYKIIHLDFEDNFTGTNLVK